MRVGSLVDEAFPPMTYTANCWRHRTFYAVCGWWLHAKSSPCVGAILTSDVPPRVGWVASSSGSLDMGNGRHRFVRATLLRPWLARAGWKGWHVTDVRGRGL